MSRRASALSCATAAGVGLAMALLLAPPAVAQQHPNKDNGFSAEKAFHVGDIDSINAFNGNLILTIPIGQTYPVGDHLSYGLTLVYNSNLWESRTTPQAEYSVPNHLFNAGFGWTLSLGRLLPPGHPSNNLPANAGSTWLYASADNGQHRFWDTLHPDYTGEPHAEYAYTRDGTYLRQRLSSAAQTVEFPDGTVHFFNAEGRLIRMQDRFNNWMNVGYTVNAAGKNVWTITDKIGRMHTITFDTGRPHYNGTHIDGHEGVVWKVNLETFEGGTGEYEFFYENESALRGCPNAGGPSSTVRVPFLTKVERPDNSTFEMPTYNKPLTGDCDSESGVLRKLKLSTLGSLEWDYTPYTFRAEDDTCQSWTYSTIGVGKRRMVHADGTVYGEWVYEPQNPTAQCGQVNNFPDSVARVVTTPEGHKTTSHFAIYRGEGATPGAGWSTADYGLPFTRDTAIAATTNIPARYLSTEVRDASDTLLRRTYVAYDFDRLGSGPFDYGQLNQRLSGRRTVYQQDGQRWTDTNLLNDDGYGHFRLTEHWNDFGGSAVRQRLDWTSYNTNRGTYVENNVKQLPVTTPWILNTFTEKKAQEGGVISTELYCFDLQTGFLERRRVLETGETPGTSDVLTVWESDTGGKGHTVREEIYGARQTLPAASGSVCAHSLPTNPAYRTDFTYQHGVRATAEPKTPAGVSLGFKTLNVEIDQSTGLPDRTVDPSGIHADLVYDNLGRLTDVLPQSGADADTEYTYTHASGSKVNIKRRDSGDNILAESEMHFDDFGRLEKEQRVMPDGTVAERNRGYYPEGWLRFQSEWGLKDVNNKPSTRYQSMDPFGRPGRVRPSDVPANPSVTERAHDIEIDYTGVRLVTRRAKVGTTWDGLDVTEQEFAVTEHYNGLGRLVKVQEKSGAGNTVVGTDYGYDVGGRLKSVQQGVQSRSFTYDNRGFLLSEKHPEKGFSGGGTVTYGDYDALGNPRLKTDGPNALEYSYDSAGRLETVARQGGEVFKSFTYGTCATTGASADRCAGKIVEAVRHNRFAAQDVVTVTETYTYEGRGGRVSSRGVEVSFGAAADESLNGGLASRGNGVLPFLDGFESGDLSAWDLVETGGGGGGFEETAVFAQTFLWDELGNPSSIGYPRCSPVSSGGGCYGSTSNRTVAPHYTKGWLTDLPGYTNAPLGTAFTYHPNGLPATIQHANGVQVIQANDPDGMRRPSSITTTGAEQNWASGAFFYDGSGNIIRMGDDYFLYDAVSRIKESRVADPSVAGIPRRYQSFKYDLYGNRTEVGDRTGGGSWTYRTYTTSTTSNRLTGWSFDAAGNQLTGPGTSGAFSFTYDLANQMKTLTGTGADERYVYTADEERLYTEDQNTGERLWTLRDLGGLVLTEYRQEDDSWLWERDYIHRAGQLFASQGRGEGYLTHYHLDHLGTPRLVTRGGGGGTGGAAVLGIYAYHPFGEEASQAQQEDIRLRFTGHERDGRGAGFTDDLDYMHARYYSPGVGRFLSVDPLSDSAHPSLPQSWNRYTYVMSNPLKYVDPYGLEAKCHTVTTGEDGEEQLICAEEIKVKGKKPKARARSTTTPWEVGWEWLSGTGPRDRFFTDGDTFTEMLKQHETIQNTVRAACAGTAKPKGPIDNNLGGIEGVPKYLRDYSTLTTGGLSGNLAATYLGSYGGRYELYGNTVYMEVKNTSAAASALRPPVLGYTNWWQSNVDPRLNNVFASGPMSATSQSFVMSSKCP